MRHSDFVNANYGLLETITQQTEEIIEQNEYAEIVVDPVAQDIAFTRGQFTSTEVQSVYDFMLTDNVADELADMHNRSLLTEASIAINGLCTMVSMNYAFQLIDNMRQEGKTDDEIRDHFSSRPLPRLSYEYGTARFAGANNGPLRVAFIALQSLEEYSDASQWNIQTSDDEVSKTLKVVSYKGRLDIVRLDVSPITNPLTERILRTLGDTTMFEVMTVLSGAFKDEDELDEVLGNVWRKHIGTSNEDVASSILDEVRNQAVARHEFAQLSSQHNLSEPSFEDLEIFRNILNSFSS